MLQERVKNIMKEVPDFPKPGISFKDITPAMADPIVAKDIVESMVAWAKPLNPDYIVGVESRGFMFGFALAQKLGIGFIPIRKAGKLPRPVLQQSYSLEYGEAVIEIHKDDIKPGSKLIIHDDLLATGGTIKAAVSLCEALEAEVLGIHFLVELEFLNGRAQLAKGININALVSYP